MAWCLTNLSTTTGIAHTTVFLWSSKNKLCQARYNSTRRQFQGANTLQYYLRRLLTRAGALGLGMLFAVSSWAAAPYLQTINFNYSNIIVGGSGSISATSMSGGTVALSSLTPLVCGLSGNTVTGLSAGTCDIRGTVGSDAF